MQGTALRYYVGSSYTDSVISLDSTLSYSVSAALFLLRLYAVVRTPAPPNTNITANQLIVLPKSPVLGTLGASGSVGGSVSLGTSVVVGSGIVVGTVTVVGSGGSV